MTDWLGAVRWREEERLKSVNCAIEHLNRESRNKKVVSMELDSKSFQKMLGLVARKK